MEKLDIIYHSLEDINAFDITIYDTNEISPFYDYLVIASVTSSRQLKASQKHISDDLAKHKFEHVRVEGKDSDSWVLIDTKDIIVNVFTKEDRLYYDLEKVLVGAKKVTISS